MDGTGDADDLTPSTTGDFDEFVKGLDYPMFVVTAAAGDERAGCLVGFATQASIDPPRLLVCLSVENHTYRVAQQATVLAVHVLEPESTDLAALFGEETGDRTDKFVHCDWTPGPDGVPLLRACQRVVVGRILRREEYGDHVGHLLQPLQVVARSTREGLDFQQVKNLDPGHPA